MSANEGVSTRNAFYLLDEDAPAKAAPKKEAKKAEPVKKPESKPQSSRREDRGDRGDRGGRGAGRRDDRGERGGRGRGRGGRGRGGRREFDRSESGTGRDRGVKKEGAGKYNWGKEGEQDDDRPRRRFDREDKRRNNRFNDESGESKPAEEGAEKAADGEADGAEKAEPKVEEDETPPEPETFSYEEYLANKAKCAEDLATRLRTVDNDESQWKSSAVKAADSKKEESDYELGSAKSGPKRTKKGKAKKTALSLDEFVKPTGGQQRGGRGRGRGRGGQGGRGSRGGNGNFNLRNDEFPTLGGKK